MAETHPYTHDATDNEHPFCAYDLDCYHSQVMTQEQASELAQHLESCAACVAYLEELTAEEAQLFEKLPVARLVEQSFAAATEAATEAQEAPKSPEGRGWASLLSSPWLWAVSVACCTLLVWKVLPPTSSPSGLLPKKVQRNQPLSRQKKGLRKMGASPVLKAYIKRDGEVTLAGRVAHVGENDALRLKATFPRRVHMVIFFLDVRGKVSWFLPEKGTLPPVIVQEGPYTSPGSIVFDSSPLTERIFVYWQAKPFAAMSIVKRVKLAWEEQDGQASFADDRWLPKMECLWSLPFVKR